jgi:hypothetical protein
VPPVHARVGRPRWGVPLYPRLALTGAAVLGLASPAAAQLPGLGGGPKTVADTIDYEPPEGTARPPAPDQRTGHVYVSLGIAANGPAGLIVSTVASSQDVGTGVTGTALVGVGLGRHGSFQIFGDGTYFSAPGSCTIGCSGHSFSLGLGVTYHLAQGIAIDPWGSFGMAYRYTSVFAPLQANVTLAGNATATVPSGTNFQQYYQGLDFARVAFGGDFYTLPFFGIGPFIEGDFGMNLARNYFFQDLQILAPSGRLEFIDQHGLSAYAFFQIGLRLTFDPMRRALARPPAPAPAAPPPGM